MRSPIPFHPSQNYRLTQCRCPQDPRTPTSTALQQWRQTSPPPAQHSGWQHQKRHASGRCVCVFGNVTSCCALATGFDLIWIMGPTAQRLAAPEKTPRKWHWKVIFAAGQGLIQQDGLSTTPTEEGWGSCNSHCYTVHSDTQFTGCFYHSFIHSLQVKNPAVLNPITHKPVAYKLMPQPTPTLLCAPESVVGQRAVSVGGMKTADWGSLPF